MFKELLEKNRYSFHKGFDNWEDAVKSACLPLLKEKAILPEYVDSIIESIKQHGPYIVIAPNICVPHAQEGSKVLETSVCFMKTDFPVSFGKNREPEYDAKLFFVLASCNPDKHLENLIKLMEVIDNENIVEDLLTAKNQDDLKFILRNFL